MPDFSKFDGARTPRPIQIDTLSKLNAAWDSSDVHALVLPVASGKSAIARAIQLATGADIITPSNLLVSQYQADYPTVNFLKGKTHYQCNNGLSCRDWCSMGFEPCHDCPYQACKARALTEPSFYNPMSLYYHLLSTRSKGNKVLVVDEAHQLGSLLLLLCSKRLKKSDYKFSQKCCNEVYLVQWLKQQIDRLDKLSALYYKTNDTEKLAKAKQEIETLALLKEGIEEDGQNFVMFIDKDAKDTYLNIRPLFPPKFLVNRLLGGKKLVLMSGTLFPQDIKALIGDRPYNVIEQNSPIPRKNRRIVFKPAPFKINYLTDPKRIAEFICQHLEPGVNTIIHSTYSLSPKLMPFMPSGTLYNTSQNKDEVLQEFKDRGGAFLASGCAEGIDLKDGLCRLNLIPKLSYPNLGDPAVQRRKALQDGSDWYAISTLATLIQQAGRSTRHADDHSVTYILDPSFGQLFRRYKHKLPKYFTESVEL
jgi:ATP-dependent DNA helicase DinG